MRHLKIAVVQAYLDRELAEPERARSETHLAECSECRAKLADLEKTHADIRAIIESLSPDRIPEAASSRQAFGEKRNVTDCGLQRLALAPIRIPAFLVVFMGATILILAGLLYSEIKHKNIDRTFGSAEASPTLVMISPEKKSPLIFDFSPKAFKPVKNPVIFKEIKP